ncbi:MAG: DUF2065 domain-containing protein [Gammaproteobacteria bacterium]|nr:MAG: DUF2065 domain-containing protein [Gammaproteobacteria bacterium]
MWQDFLAALALVLVIEGILPFINPAGYREAVRRIAQLDDRQLRALGLGAMLAGALMLSLVR